MQLLSNVTLCCVQFPRRIRGCSAWSSTLTRTCPSTQSPSWRCTGARNATKCPRTSTPYQKLPIGACCKVLSTISDLLPIAEPDTGARPYICYQMENSAEHPPLWSLSSQSALCRLLVRVWCSLKPWLMIKCLKSENSPVDTTGISGCDTP